MQFETLCSLIEASTPAQLRALAGLVLRLQGYQDSRVTDGPYDGGSDLRVLRNPGAPLPLAIQTSVEKKWQKKLREDAATIKKRLRLDRILFISSRRIPQATFLTVQAELIGDLGVSVTPIDQQSMASLIIEHHALPELLAILDIPASIAERPQRPADLRRDAAFAYAFFSPEVRSFRNVIRERSLLLALSNAGVELKIDDLCETAARLLGAPMAAATQFGADVDRLRQSGRLLGRNGSVSLPDAERAELEALRALRAQEDRDLRAEVHDILARAQLSPLAEAVDVATEGLGALLLQQSGDLAALDDLREQLRRLRAELRAFGLPEGGRGEDVLASLVECARSSPLGRHLAAGSLYRAVTNLDRDALLRALDARTVSIVLDASVAIPMLCALYHGSVRQRFFLAAAELHRRAANLGFTLVLPEVWLEEMAAHLLRALDYTTLAQDEPESLRLSRNAYVAYFANARANDSDEDFASFLESFGLTTTLVQRAAHDFHGARVALESCLRRELSRYQIGVVATPSTVRNLQAAQRDWDWALLEIGVPQRADILIRHDTQVLAWLAGSEATHTHLLVTWDKLIKKIRPDNTLDPLAVSELLSFVRGEAMPTEGIRFAELWLTEAEAERSAVVLDTLVRIEKMNLSDARLARVARQFRAQYLAERRDLLDVVELERDWKTFREQALASEQ